MIRKWFKINTCFAEILKSTSGSTKLEKSEFEHPSKQYLSFYTPKYTSLSPRTLHWNSTTSHTISNVVAEDSQSDSDESYSAVAETPARTELFHVKGPQGAAFLIEVEGTDLNEVKTSLTELKGGNFHFDKSIIKWFGMKCILAGEPEYDGGDSERLAKVHAISSGSEEVYLGSGKYFFVNSIDRTMRAKRILERLGYRISWILYRFQPKQKVNLDGDVRVVCEKFLRDVENLPKVISVTHNL